MAANLNKVLTGESKNLLLSQFSPMTGNYLFLNACKIATCTSGFKFNIQDTVYKCTFAKIGLSKKTFFQIEYK